MVAVAAIVHFSPAMSPLALPAPLVMADVDLRGYEFMPFYGNRLLTSDFNSKASDAAYRAAVNLWWQAWNQVPAASLPDDDSTLCKLADLGDPRRDPKALRVFAKLRGMALAGFVKCSDGRLYHRQLSVWALEAWARRLRDRKKKADWRHRQDVEKQRVEPECPGSRTGTEPGRNRDGTAERRGEDRTGEEVKSLTSPTGEVVVDAPASRARPTCPACPHDKIVELYHETLPANPHVLEWNNTRQGFLRARWREKFVAGKYATLADGLSWWRKYFRHVGRSRFLTGRADPQKGRPPFVADLEWLIRPSNFAHVVEGKYLDD